MVNSRFLEREEKSGEVSDEPWFVWSKASHACRGG